MKAAGKGERIWHLVTKSVLQVFQLELEIRCLQLEKKISRFFFNFVMCPNMLYLFSNMGGAAMMGMMESRLGETNKGHQLLMKMGKFSLKVSLYSPYIGQKYFG